MRRAALAIAFSLIAAPLAASEAQTDALWDALRFDDYAAVLVAEGTAGGEDLDASLFGGEGGSGWVAAVAAIYDGDRIARVLGAELHAQLDGHDMGAAVAFFEGDTGARSVELEISARWALLDPDIEDASVEHMQQMDAEGDPRLDLIGAFSDINGLVDNNVASTMNGNYAFLQALSAAGQGPYANDTAAMMAAVWEQEPEIRAETEEWVLSFFAFAYAPLSDAEVQELVDFSLTPEGKRLNSALFAAFDVLYTGISADLGRTAARYMTGERL